MAHYDHFHSLKILTVGYQVSHNRLVLTFVFDETPANHGIGIICRLIEEEFHLRKHNMKTIVWSKNLCCRHKKGRGLLTFLKLL